MKTWSHAHRKQGERVNELQLLLWVCVTWSGKCTPDWTMLQERVRTCTLLQLNKSSPPLDIKEEQTT